MEPKKYHSFIQILQIHITIFTISLIIQKTLCHRFVYIIQFLNKNKKHQFINNNHNKSDIPVVINVRLIVNKNPQQNLFPTIRNYKYRVCGFFFRFVLFELTKIICGIPMHFSIRCVHCSAFLLRRHKHTESIVK